MITHMRERNQPINPIDLNSTPTMSIDPAQGPPPISRLKQDILYEIFLTNAKIDKRKTPYWIHRDHHGHILDSARWASQVCRTWRKLLLHSPSIWAKCIYLDELDQMSDDWRNLVLERTGKASLTVWGDMCGMWQTESGTGMERFCLRLIHEEYNRIAELDVYMGTNILNLPHTWEIFGRPWNALKEFSIVAAKNLTGGRDPDPPSKIIPPDFKLFSNQQLLVRLCLHTFGRYEAIRKLEAPLISCSMRILDLQHQGLDFVDIDLLNACRQLTNIEELRLHMSSFTISGQTEGNSRLRLSLPHLDAIFLAAPTLEVYTDFLKYLFPRPGCRLVVQFYHGRRNPWMQLQSTEMHSRYISMLDVINRYIFSSFNRLERPSENNNAPEKCHLTVYQGAEIDLSFISYTQDFIRLHFGLNIVPPDIFQLILETVLTIKLPMTVTKMWINIDSYLLDPIIPPFFKEFFESMNHISELGATPLLLEALNLEQSPGSEDPMLFPCIQTLSLITISIDWTGSSDNSMLHFLRNRQARNAFVPFLDLRGISPPNSLKIDMRYLDALTGLQVILKPLTFSEYERQYVCGSGDKDKLIIFNHNPRYF